MAENDNSNNHEYTILVVYTSNLQRWAIPRSVTHIRVHIDVQVLPVWALSKLTHLETVEFPMGSRVIGNIAAHSLFQTLRNRSNSFDSQKGPGTKLTTI